MSSGAPPPNPQRGELWWVRFEPRKGQEVGKTRPALVVGEPTLGNWSLRIIVPVLTDKGRHAKLPWFVTIPQSARSGLTKDSEVDASQVKSVSLERFAERMGGILAGQLADVVDAIVLCLGFELPGQR